MPAEVFQPGSPTHLVTATVCVFAMVAALVMGKRLLPTPARERRFRDAWAWGTLAFQLAAVGWWLSPDRRDWSVSLPLQLCDLAGFVAPVALLTGRRWARILLYFWGLGLSTQAFITPTLAVGPSHTHFWVFWMAHIAIVGSALYEVVVLGFRPSAKDLGKALAMTWSYIILIAVFDWITGFNYAFVGPGEAPAGTLVAALGPWPWRVLVMMLMGSCVFAVLWGVWPLARAVGQAAGRASGRRGT